MDQRGLGTFLFIAFNVFYVKDETSQHFSEKKKKKLYWALAEFKVSEHSYLGQYGELV